MKNNVVFATVTEFNRRQTGGRAIIDGSIAIAAICMHTCYMINRRDGGKPFLSDQPLAQEPKKGDRIVIILDREITDTAVAWKWGFKQDWDPRPIQPAAPVEKPAVTEINENGGTKKFEPVVTTTETNGSDVETNATVVLGQGGETLVEVTELDLEIARVAKMDPAELARGTNGRNRHTKKVHRDAMKMLSLS